MRRLSCIWRLVRALKTVTVRDLNVRVSDVRVWTLSTVLFLFSPSFYFFLPVFLVPFSSAIAMSSPPLLSPSCPSPPLSSPSLSKVPLKKLKLVSCDNGAKKIYPVLGWKEGRDALGGWVCPGRWGRDSPWLSNPRQGSGCNPSSHHQEIGWVSQPYSRAHTQKPNGTG